MNNMEISKDKDAPKELSELTIKDLKDYQADMEDFNSQMALLDKDMQEQAKTKRGRNWRGGYLMAMIILNANNASVTALQKERDAWFIEAQKMGEITKNAEDMAIIQTGLSQTGMTRENELKHEHQKEIGRYLEVLTLLKRFPDTLKAMSESSAEDIIRELKKIEIKNQK